MTQSNHHRTRIRTSLLVIVLVVAAAAAFSIRSPLYTAIATSAAELPLHRLIGLVAESGLFILVATAAFLAVVTWLRARAQFWLLAAGGVGVITAYLASEAIKLVVGQPRPCQLIDVRTVIACPTVGDWSWPSNHSVIAAAIAMACIVIAPRMAWWAMSTAGVIAFARVAAGVHYVHDVLSGLALGIVIVLSVIALLRPVISRLQKPAAAQGSRKESSPNTPPSTWTNSAER